MSFRVNTPQANQIARVALIRNGSITHGFNSDQRYVVLTFSVERHALGPGAAEFL